MDAVNAGTAAVTETFPTRNSTVMQSPPLSQVLTKTPCMDKAHSEAAQLRVRGVSSTGVWGESGWEDSDLELRGGYLLSEICTQSHSLETATISFDFLHCKDSCTQH